MVESVGAAPTAPILQGSAGPWSTPQLVPGVGFDPTCPRLQRGAITRFANRANKYLPINVVDVLPSATHPDTLVTFGAQRTNGHIDILSNWSG